MDKKINFRIMRKILSIVILVAFVTTSIRMPAYAQVVSRESMPWMPQPGTLLRLSPQFAPAQLKGMVIHPENALRFDFIVNKGDEQFSDQEKKQEYQKLIKYFLASLAIPDEDQWVNLSPYEKDRIIKEDFGKTEMGRDLLAQDYILKQITSSLIYPEDKVGRKFWDKIYERAYKEYGTTNIPVNTFNKVWIIPENAVVYEHGNAVYLLRNHLKVLLEADYLALQKFHASKSILRNQTRKPFGEAGLPQKNSLANAKDDAQQIGTDVVRQIVLPELEREVNTGKNFANLRQVYSGMILAAWYKRVLKESLLGQIYANHAKVKGVDQDPKTNQAIYQQYLKAFKKGVFNYIKEDVDKYSQESIPRKYFSGGTKGITSMEMLTPDFNASNGEGRLVRVPQGSLAMLSSDLLVGAGVSKTPDEIAVADMNPANAARAMTSTDGAESKRSLGVENPQWLINSYINSLIPTYPLKSIRNLVKIKSILEEIFLPKGSEERTIQSIADEYKLSHTMIGIIRDNLLRWKNVSKRKEFLTKRKAEDGKTPPIERGLNWIRQQSGSFILHELAEGATLFEQEAAAIINNCEGLGHPKNNIFRWVKVNRTVTAEVSKVEEELKSLLTTAIEISEMKVTALEYAQAIVDFFDQNKIIGPNGNEESLKLESKSNGDVELIVSKKVAGQTHVSSFTLNNQRIFKDQLERIEVLDSPPMAFLKNQYGSVIPTDTILLNLIYKTRQRNLSRQPNHPPLASSPAEPSRAMVVRYVEVNQAFKEDTIPARDEILKRIHQDVFKDESKPSKSVEKWWDDAMKEILTGLYAQGHEMHGSYVQPEANGPWYLIGVAGAAGTENFYIIALEKKPRLLKQFGNLPPIYTGIANVIVQGNDVTVAGQGVTDVSQPRFGSVEKFNLKELASRAMTTESLFEAASQLKARISSLPAETQTKRQNLLMYIELTLALDDISDAQKWQQIAQEVIKKYPELASDVPQIGIQAGVISKAMTGSLEIGSDRDWFRIFIGLIKADLQKSIVGENYSRMIRDNQGIDFTSGGDSTLSLIRTNNRELSKAFIELLPTVLAAKGIEGLEATYDIGESSRTISLHFPKAQGVGRKLLRSFRLTSNPNSKKNLLNVAQTLVTWLGGLEGELKTKQTRNFALQADGTLASRAMVVRGKISEIILFTRGEIQEKFSIDYRNFIPLVFTVSRSKDDGTFVGKIKGSNSGNGEEVFSLVKNDKGIREEIIWLVPDGKYFRVAESVKPKQEHLKLVIWTDGFHVFVQVEDHFRYHSKLSVSSMAMNSVPTIPAQATVSPSAKPSRAMTAPELAAKITGLGLKEGDNVQFFYSFTGFLSSLPDVRSSRVLKGQFVSYSFSDGQGKLVVKVNDVDYELYFGQNIPEDSKILINVIKISNKAMNSDVLNKITESRKRQGGINMNSANMDLQIKRDGNGMPLPLIRQDMAMLAAIPGFVPEIIEIRSAFNLPIISELQKKFQNQPA